MGLTALLRVGAGGSVESQREEFWALRNVSFELKQGEVLGVIGRNGAGKSTLLKVLSRITEPTTGKVSIEGRVASLLEVGTGFHPELTGRENIFLNGSILGLSRKVVRQKFDQIAKFAEIDQFLDTPVKRYSSGMYTRLAFAVAAHLEPDILVIDEVLAVGDQAFREKCLDRMNQVAQGGRTVIFVSHQIGPLRQLCTTGLVLNKGQVAASGTIQESLDYYLRTISRKAETNVADRNDRGGSGARKLTALRVEDPTTGSEVLTTGGQASFKFEVDRYAPNVSVIFSIYTIQNQQVLSIQSPSVESRRDDADTESTAFTCLINELLLLPGTYRINTAVKVGKEIVDHLEYAATFDVVEGIIDGQVIKSNGQNLIYHRHVWERQSLN